MINRHIKNNIKNNSSLQVMVMLVMLVIFSLITALPAQAESVVTAKKNAQAAVNDSWRFKVLLDGKPIGQHSFHITRHNDQSQIKIDARFAVSFFGFTAYTYQHNNTEHWQGQCLSRIQASTNDNGERLIVDGTRNNNGFALKTVDARNTLSACPKSFAYWNLDHMKSPQLLNSQTGELMKVRLQEMGNDTLAMADGQSIPAKRYRLSGRNLQIDLWYSAQNRWVGLESIKDGRQIRYVLQ